MAQQLTITTVGELYKASKLHEKNLVIELGIDRIVTWLGVYFIFILGVLLEVDEIFGSRRGLSCFPENYTGVFTKPEAELASLNCWEIPSTAIFAHRCLEGNSTSVNLADYNKLDTVTSIVKVLPLLLVFQAILTSLPTVWWHFNFGSRLLAHLKLIQFLLDKICEAATKIEKVECSGKPYDSDSAHFIGKMPFCDPGIELALHRMNNACHNLVVAHDSKKFRFSESYYKTLLRDIRKSIKKLCDYLNEKINAENEQKYKEDLKTFREIQNFFKKDPLDKKARFLLKSTNYSTLKEKCVSGLKKISERKTSFFEIIEETFKDSSLKLKDFCDYTLGVQLPWNKILEDQMMLLKMRITIRDDIKESMGTFEKKIAILCELKKELDTLCTCLKSLERKLCEHNNHEMLDRHFLSLLCYENFASLYYIPYIYLLFRVFERKIYAGFSYVEERNRGKKENPEHKYAFYSQKKLTMEAALMSWCHPDNMTTRRLVSNYLKKQYFTIVIASVGVLLFGGFFISISILVNVSSQNLHCALPHICLICSLLRKTRLYILIVIACCSYGVVLGMLIYQVVTFNDRLPTNNSHLFELLQDLSMEALNENEENDSSEGNLLGLLKKAAEKLPVSPNEDESDAGNDESVEGSSTTGGTEQVENEPDRDNEDPATNANQRATTSAAVQPSPQFVGTVTQIKEDNRTERTKTFHSIRAMSSQNAGLSDERVDQQTKPFLTDQV